MADPPTPLDEQSAAVVVLRRLRGTALGQDVNATDGTIQEAFCALANLSAALSDPPSDNFLKDVEDAPVSQEDIDLITRYAASLGCTPVAPPSPMPPPGPMSPPAPMPPSWPSAWPRYKLEAFNTNGCSKQEGYQRIDSAAECEAASSSYGEYQELYTPMTQMPAGCFRQDADDNSSQPFVYFNSDPKGGPHQDCAPICVLPGVIVKSNSSAGAGAGAGGGTSMKSSTNQSVNSPVNSSMPPNAPPPFVVSLVSPPPPAGIAEDTVIGLAHCSAGSHGTAASDCYEYDMEQYNESNFDCDVLGREYADFGSFCASWVSNNFTYNGGTGVCDRAMASRVIKVDCIDGVRSETILQKSQPAPSVPEASPEASPEAPPEASPEVSPEASPPTPAAPPLAGRLAANMMFFCNDGAGADATCYEYASEDFPDGKWGCTDKVYASFEEWCKSWTGNGGEFNGGTGVCDTTSEIVKSECTDGESTKTVVQYAPPPSSSPTAGSRSSSTASLNPTFGLVMAGAWCADVAQPEMDAARTAEECAQHCHRTAGCRFFVFAEEEGRCWQSDTGDDAGCPTSWVLDDRWNFYEVGIKYSLVRDLGYCGGADMPAMDKAADAATCADYCAAREEGCSFFAVAPADKSCLVAAVTSAGCAKDDSWVADDRWAFYEMLGPPSTAARTSRRVRR